MISAPLTFNPTLFGFVICILTSPTCMLRYRDRDPVHLQLILKETGTEEEEESGSGGSGLFLLGCSSVSSPPLVVFTSRHGGKQETITREIKNVKLRT